MNAPVQASIESTRAVATPYDLLRIVVEQNAPIEKIRELMELLERHEANTARRAFNQSLAMFREQKIRVIRSASVNAGPLRGTSYARLSDFVNASAPALSECGLSASWKITRDEPDWIEVACILRHRDGHQEETKMGGPPDVGGAKNSIQARASTVSYLEKYTLKMATGIAEEDDDDDGNGGQSTDRSAGCEATLTKPIYSDADFEKNLPSWKGMVTSGTKTPDQIITRLQIRATLTQKQINTIKALATTEDAVNA